MWVENDALGRYLFLAWTKRKNLDCSLASVSEVRPQERYC